MTQACYDLARLRGNGLIERIARTNTYRLTAGGLAFALVYSPFLWDAPATGPRRPAFRWSAPHATAPPGPGGR